MPQLFASVLAVYEMDPSLAARRLEFIPTLEDMVTAHAFGLLVRQTERQEGVPKGPGDTPQAASWRR